MSSRKYQYRLRTLFVVMTACCVVLGFACWRPPFGLGMLGVLVMSASLVWAVYSRRYTDAVIVGFLWALMVALTFSPAVSCGSGRRSLQIPILVRDAETGKAIEGARVWVCRDGSSRAGGEDGMNPPVDAWTTRPDGTAQLAVECSASETTYHYDWRRPKRTRYTSLSRLSLNVRAPGYAQLVVPLSEYVDEDSVWADGPIARVSVGLTGLPPAEEE